VPPPSAVSVSTGLVACRLYDIFGQPTQQELMLMQMIDGQTIKVEVFMRSTAGTGQFDARAYTYVR
jgi:hypothetical protein